MRDKERGIRTTKHWPYEMRANKQKRDSKQKANNPESQKQFWRCSFCVAEPRGEHGTPSKTTTRTRGYIFFDFARTPSKALARLSFRMDIACRLHRLQLLQQNWALVNTWQKRLDKMTPLLPQTTFCIGRAGTQNFAMPRVFRLSASPA